MELGGAISAEHGIGTEKRRYFLELEDPAKVELMRRIKAVVRPQRDPQPREAARMKGAHALMRTLVGAGVDVCFANPGTSEMHFVAALDDVPEMRAVLGLFEGVVTGAADGYGRMAGRPAATLLHLGPGAGQRDRQPAQRPAGADPGGERRRRPRHRPSPLRRARCSPTSRAWPDRSRAGTARPPTSATLAGDTAEAVAAASRSHRAGVATLVVPADLSWSDGAEVAAARGPEHRGAPCPPTRSNTVAKLLAGGEPTRHPRSAGRRRAPGGSWPPAGSPRPAGPGSWPRPSRPCSSAARACPRSSAWPISARWWPSSSAASATWSWSTPAPPVSFFAYPGQPGSLVPDGCDVHVLAAPGDDAVGALEALAEAVGAPADGRRARTRRGPSGPPARSTPMTAAAAIGALLPEGAVVSDEANTAGLFLPGATAGAPRHDWLCLTGGAIGQGMPVATGAAVACPEPPRPVARRPTAAPCTRCSRCGPRPARGWT